MDASYEIRIDVDGCSYLLRLQTGGKRKVAVLQAIRVCKTEKRQSFELITRNPLLWCLLELVLFEKCR